MLFLSGFNALLFDFVVTFEKALKTATATSDVDHATKDTGKAWPFSRRIIPSGWDNQGTSVRDPTVDLQSCIMELPKLTPVKVLCLPSTRQDLLVMSLMTSEAEKPHRNPSTKHKPGSDFNSIIRARRQKLEFVAIKAARILKARFKREGETQTGDRCSEAPLQTFARALSTD